MMDIPYTAFDTKEEQYAFIVRYVKLLSEETHEMIPLLANLSALLKMELDNVNWAGFYLLKGGRLILGPFQGKPAVAEINVGEGVCGTAIKENRTQLIENVHKCSNHIACDASTMSEIVVPIEWNANIWGVIDIDSPIPERFDQRDKKGLEAVSHTISDILDKSIASYQ